MAWEKGSRLPYLLWESIDTGLIISFVLQTFEYQHIEDFGIKQPNTENIAKADFNDV